MMPGIKRLNYEEDKVIEEFKMRMKSAITPVMREDPTLFYRFLKARDFNIDNAEKMMRKHLTWRKVNQIDNILKDFKPKEFFSKYPEPSFIGYDKDGDIVLYAATGKLNVYEIFQCAKMNDLLKHFYWFGEKYTSLLRQQSEKTGKLTFRGSLIMDLDKLTVANAVAKLSVVAFLHFVHVYQDNYPERLKSLYVINAPSYYTFVFSIIKNVMANAVIKKIHICSHGGWENKLLEFIDADVLPAFLGGKRTDPDGNPLCETFLTFGGTIPEKYFLTDEERYFKDNKRVKRATIAHSTKTEIYVDVEEVGVILEWEFLVKGKDIGFGLSFKVSEKETQIVIPVYKYDTSDGTQRDSYKCHSAGRYIVIFDNSYSWFSSKSVDYCITIMEAKD